MTLQQALDNSMDGPFSVAYARAEHLNIGAGLVEFVVSTTMAEGSAVVRQVFGRRSEWRFCYIVNVHGMDWRPLVDSQIQANVDKAYAKGLEAVKKAAKKP